MISMDRFARRPYRELFGQRMSRARCTEQGDGDARARPLADSRSLQVARCRSLAAGRSLQVARFNVARAMSPLGVGKLEAGRLMHVRGVRSRGWSVARVDVAVAIAGAALVACSGHDTTLMTGGERDGASRVVESLGQLYLPLVTAGRESYRLRHAVFDVTRPAGAVDMSRPGGEWVASLDAEADANAPSLSLAIAPGSYLVTLEPGWWLERLTASGAEPVSAALISPEAQAFAIRRGQATDVRYVFSTIAGPLTLGESRLTVRTEVTPAAALPACDVLEPGSCPAGEACLLAGDGGDSFCARAGSLAVGAPCSAEGCVAGAQCMYLDPAQPGSGSCAAFCSTEAPAPGCDCYPLQVDAKVGVCLASGAGASAEPAARVLVAGSPVEPSWNLDVQAKLVQTGAFVGVDVLDVSQATPSVEDLRAYAAVLVYTDAPLADADALGDGLADYFDGGGRVVIAAFANATLPLGGRWASEGYALIEALGQAQARESEPLGVVESGSPLLTGVSSLTATSAFGSLGGPINGGVVVATWGSGAPLIVRGLHGGRARVDLNLYPPSGDVRRDLWRGSGAELLRNALSFH
jgi:hypothetical protein